jgi:type IV pilus assembly protein PilW
MYKQKGITLIELLVALTILGIVIGSIYRLFIVQTRAYTVQDEVVEVQQNVRGAMEFLLRDLRMTGYDNDTTAVMVPTPVKLPVLTSDIEVSYEHENHKRTVRYWRDGSVLKRQLSIDDVPNGTPDDLLENVDALTFTYGVDENEDGIMDDQNLDDFIDDQDWLPAGPGITKVVAVHVTLTGRPNSDNPDVQQRVSPRELTSAVTFRNLIIR